MSDNISFNGKFSDNVSTLSGNILVDFAAPSVAGEVTTNTPKFGALTFNNLSIAMSGSGGDYIIADAVSNPGYEFYTSVHGMPPTQLDETDVYATNGGSGFYNVENLPVTSTEVPCFASGTSIKTSNGDCSVETLTKGDCVLAASGEWRTISWVGHRVTSCRSHPRSHQVMPIRIAAHAFGNNRPIRDLRVSPGHAICVNAVGEVLIPAAALVNGTTIVQEHVESVTYWHVELENGHDIILAENLPCESYIEMGNRSFFAEANTTSLHANPDSRIITHADFCRPFHQDGPVVSFVRERLAARSPDLGWNLEEEPFANLHLLADGRRVEAETNGLCARFLVTAHSKEVWLISDTSVPAEIGIAPDLRSLGICIGNLVIDDGFGTPRTVRADDRLLSVGFHNIENGPQRWTAGRARLPDDLWQGCHGSFFLRVELTRPALPRWVAKADAVSKDLKKLLA